MGNKEENNFIHKLSKYQTLYTSQNGNKDIYQQKINYYTRKLNDMGIANHQGGVVKWKAGDEITPYTPPEEINEVMNALLSTSVTASVNPLQDELEKKFLESVNDVGKCQIKSAEATARLSQLSEILQRLSLQRSTPVETLQDKVTTKLNKYYIDILNKVGLLNALEFTGSESSLLKIKEATGDEIYKLLKDIGKLSNLNTILEKLNSTYGETLLVKLKEITKELNNIELDGNKFENKKNESNFTNNMTNYNKFNEFVEYIKNLIVKIHTKLNAQNEVANQLIKVELDKLIKSINKGKDTIFDSSLDLLDKDKISVKPQAGGFNKLSNKSNKMSVYKINDNIFQNINLE
jgi:hypothetical protein